MNNDKTIRLETIRDIELALKDAQQDGFIIPDIVFNVIENVKDRPYPDLPGEVINELTEHGD